MNIDPLSENFSAISPYTYSLNNPLFFVDPDGREVKNADEERRKQAEKNVESTSASLDEKANYLGVSSNASRRKFKKAAKAKGGKQEWKNTKTTLSESKKAKQNLTKYEGRSKETAKRIKEFADSSPERFAAMDNMTNEFGEVVDVYVSTVTLTNQNGENKFSFSEDLNGDVRLKSQFGGLNSIMINLTPSQSIKAYGAKIKISSFQTTSHEMGHANYAIENTRSYYQFWKNNKGNWMNGHRPDDPSAKRANEWEGNGKTN